MPDDLARFVIKQVEQLELDRANFDTLYDDVSDYILPQRAKVNARRTPGSVNTTVLFDGTAPDAVSIASAAAHGSLSPNSLLWFMPTIDEELMDLEGVRDWLYEIGLRAFRTLHQSNFDAESQEVWMDLFAYNTGCLLTLEDPEDDVRFTAFQPGYFAVEEDERGVVNTLARWFELSAVAAARRFGAENLPARVVKDLEGNKPFTRRQYVHYVFPRTAWPSKFPLPPEANKAVVSLFLELSSKQIVSVSGFDEFPYAVPRWHKASGEKYGRGPGINALPDIKTLNKRVYLQLRAEAKAIDPPMGIFERSVVGDLSFAPGSLNVVRRSTGGREPIFPLYGDASRSVQFTELSVDKMRAIISRRFLLDQIQFPPMEGTPASATEIVSRMELMQRILGPVYGRVLREWHQPMLFRVVQILRRRGKLPPPPQALEGQTANLVFRFDNPVTRAQGFADIDAITRSLSTIGAFVDRWEEIADYADVREMGRIILRSGRVPEVAIRDDAQADEVRDARLQAAEEAAQAEDAVQTADALGKAAPGIEAFRGN